MATIEARVESVGRAVANEDRRAELSRRIIENRQRLDMHNRLSSAEITDQKIATIKWLSKRVAEDEALLAKLYVGEVEVSAHAATSS